MASLKAVIRGLAAGHTTVMFATGGSLRRALWKGGLNNTGVRELTRTMRRSMGHSTVKSGIRAMIQKRTRQAFSRSKRTPVKILQQIRTRLFHTSRARRSQPNPTPNSSATADSANEHLSLGQRLRKLSREYGWSALGVYLALTALDLPLCYLLVRYLGTDRIGEWEHIIVSNIKRLIPESVKEKWREYRIAVKQAERQTTGNEEITDHVEMAGWGVEEANERNKRDASLATQLALAYAIHKSFIFIRVPLVAAITPKVVKVLRGWGWDIGKRTTKEAKAIKRSIEGKPSSK